MQNQSSCPAYPHYTQEEWHKIEQSVAELPEQSPLIPALQDYMDLLDKLEACQKYWNWIIFQNRVLCENSMSEKSIWGFIRIMKIIS